MQSYFVSTDVTPEKIELAEVMICYRRPSQNEANSRHLFWYKLLSFCPLIILY